VGGEASDLHRWSNSRTRDEDMVNEESSEVSDNDPHDSGLLVDDQGYPIDAAADYDSLPPSTSQPKHKALDKGKGKQLVRFIIHL
jgi:hypothetical protein